MATGKCAKKILFSSRLIIQVLLFVIFSVLFAFPAIRTYQKREVRRVQIGVEQFLNLVSIGFVSLKKRHHRCMYVAPRIDFHCCPITFSIYYLGSLDLEGPFYSIYISMQPKAAPVKHKSRNNCHIYESQISLFHFYPSSTGDCGGI